jgi:penicillin-binding protein 2
MATILNGGRLITPHLNRDAAVDSSERFLTDETLQIIQEGMRLCIEKGPPAPTGTGKLAKVPGFDIIGKTGSAQVTSLIVQEKYETEEDIPYRFKDHAWFVAGVLDREPKIAICILVEHGHHGSSVAAPFAKDIVEFFYADQDANPVQLAREEEVN